MVTDEALQCLYISKLYQNLDTNISILYIYGHCSLAEHILVISSMHGNYCLTAV